jgi:hypothetical protein
MYDSLLLLQLQKTILAASKFHFVFSFHQISLPLCLHFDYAMQWFYASDAIFKSYFLSDYNSGEILLEKVNQIGY